MQPKTRLGHYEILSALGKGGMGEVWRARDTQLGREVAIKTLPESFAQDPERLARFEREARLLAAVNHPNVAVIYGLEEAAGERFLALELVEGETLADRLRRGPLPVEQALKLALQIAEALEATHERGVVHRDLKPGNIQITPGDNVKVLDFGLAKAFGVGGRNDGLSASPMLSVAVTERSMIFGTAAYMAPEQARGEPADARADVWAFGCILFEMLSGKGTFDGHTTPDVLAAVLTVDPDWTRLPPSLHPRVAHLLERCLEKEPRDRYQGIADARVEIRKALADPRGVLVRHDPRDRRKRTVVLAASVVGALLVSGLVTGISVWQLKPSPPPAQTVRFTQELAQGPGLVDWPAIDISRDGRRVAYTAGPASAQQRIHIRGLDDTAARPVDHPPGYLLEPRFSPDGQWLAYFLAPPSIWRVPVSGGAPQEVVGGDAVSSVPRPIRGLDWDERDRLLYAQPDGIFEVPASGGTPRLIVAPRDGEQLASPRRLPGGDVVLFTAARGTSDADWDAGDVVVYSPASGERTVVWPGGRDARYVASGHLVFARGSALYAVPFDLARLRVVGSPVPVIDRGIIGASVAYSSSAQYAVSDTGALAHLEAPASLVPRRVLVWLHRDGTEQPIPIQADNYSTARVSPDGRRVVLEVGAATTAGLEIWILDLETENSRRLPVSELLAGGPVWSADGEQLYFRSMRPDSAGIYAVPADGGEPQLIARHSPDFPYAAPWSISPDGETLALINSITFDDVRIATLGVQPGSEFREILRGAHTPVIAPNGAWVAHTVPATAADPERVWLSSYPDARRQQYDVAPGARPVFSRDGRELFYIADGVLWSVPIQYEPALDIGTPARVSDGTHRYTWAHPHPDGERFMMIREDDAAGADGNRFRLHVVVNWAEELGRRVPTR